MKLNNHILGCLAASALVLSACSSDENLNVPNGGDDLVFGDGSKVVTFTINSEGNPVSSRAYKALPVGSTISDGSQTDVLVFAVYEVTKGNFGEESYTLATQFRKEGQDVGLFPQGVGQNAIAVTPESWPVTIKLALDPSKEYRLAFWAQNTTCTAYNTEDLANVKVSYEGALCNDELRDAFCAYSANFTGGSEKQEVILHRPFAQVNVGTSGADYNNIVHGANVIPNKNIKYSRIQIKGACDQLNVLNDRISKSENVAGEKDGVVEFTWNKIPAFIHYDGTEFPDDLVGRFISTYGDETPEFEGFESVSQFQYVGENDDEEFLMVNLNQKEHANLNGYLINYPTVRYKNDEDGEETNEIDEYLTETFKYLAMAYVLIPSQPTIGIDPSFGLVDPNQPSEEATSNPYDVYYSTTVDNVKVSFAENADGTDNNAAYDEEKAKEPGYTVTETVPAFDYYLTIDNVPVHRNWRTNILGGLYAPKGPDTPDDPDDPTSIFRTTKICVHLCPIFFNENNGIWNSEEGTSWLEVGNAFPNGDENDGDNWHNDHETTH